jgi:hypothetical protein
MWMTSIAAANSPSSSMMTQPERRRPSMRGCVQESDEDDERGICGLGLRDAADDIVRPAAGIDRRAGSCGDT